jgi:hypothetical protein
MPTRHPSGQLEGRGIMIGHFHEDLRLAPGEAVRRPVTLDRGNLPCAA